MQSDRAARKSYGIVRGELVQAIGDSKFEFQIYLFS